MIYLLLIFLPSIYAQAAVQKSGLYVKGRNNESYRVDRYSTYKNYIDGIEKLLLDNTRDTYNFALQFSYPNSNSAILISNTTPEKLVLLELLYSFNLRNTSFTNFLLKVAKLCDFSDSQEIRRWINSNFIFPSERIYSIIKYISVGNLPLPKFIIEQLYFLSVNYKIFEKAASDGDTDVIEWLLKHDIYNDQVVEPQLIEQMWKSGKTDVITLLMKYEKINNKNVLKNIVYEQYNNNKTLLHVAARYGYANAAELLVTNFGANINAKDVDGKSPLYRAVEFDKHSVVDLLVNKGANTQEEPLLAVAVQRGNVETIKKLITLGVPLEIKDKNGDGPLFLAVKNNDVELLKLLGNIDRVKKILNSTNDLGDTLMHAAASKGFLDSVKILAKLGTPIDSKNYFGETPLYKAIESKNLEVTNFLIDSGADIRKRTDFGDTILHLAASLGNMEIIKLLLSNKFRLMNVVNLHGEIPVYKAAIAGHCQAAKLLVENGGDLNIKFDGMTMLHNAASEGNEKAVICLLECGMNVDVSGLMDVTPLHLAITYGHEKVVRRLLDGKANPNTRTRNLWTPLHRAVLTDNINIIKLLINYGADKTAKFDDKWTPYYLAMEHNKKIAANEVRITT